MKLYVDLETLQLIEAPGFRNPVTSLRFKRGDAARLEVAFLANGTTPAAIGDPASLDLQFGIKPRGRYDVGYLVQESAWTLPAPDAAPLVYLCSPGFNTGELDSAMQVDSSTGTELAEITLMGEITWREGTGEPTSTRTSTVVVENDVNRGDEAAPTSLPTPDDWLAQRVYPKAMAVLGVLSAGGERVVFPSLPFYVVYNGKPRFGGFGALVDFEVYWSGTGFVLTNDEGVWTSTADVFTPDLVPAGAWHATTNPTAWKPAAGSSGTPVVVSADVTTAQTVTASGVVPITTYLTGVMSYSDSHDIGLGPVPNGGAVSDSVHLQLFFPFTEAYAGDMLAFDMLDYTGLSVMEQNVQLNVVEVTGNTGARWFLFDIWINGAYDSSSPTTLKIDGRECRVGDWGYPYMLASGAGTLDEQTFDERPPARLKGY